MGTSVRRAEWLRPLAGLIGNLQSATIYHWDETISGDQCAAGRRRLGILWASSASLGGRPPPKRGGPASAGRVSRHVRGRAAVTLIEQPDAAWDQFAKCPPEGLRDRTGVDALGNLHICQKFRPATFTTVERDLQAYDADQHPIIGRCWPAAH
jgi:hypothetical protein